MDTQDILLEAHGRIRPLVESVLDGADDRLLTTRLDPQANTVGWLVWHLTRVQDDHVAEVAGHPQTWTTDGFADRAGLPFDDAEIGYGFSADQVAATRVDADLLREYHRAVADRTAAYLATLDETALDAVVDDRWEPPVTLGVRLVSVVDDSLQHVGQAAFLAGVLGRR